MSRIEKQTEQRLSSFRETIESVWIAVILAFALRAFVIEAFVIPTGSMAPRLMGKHWEFTCPACQYHYAYGAPYFRRPMPPGQASRLSSGSDDLVSPPPMRCPNCGWQLHFGKRYIRGGDRVLVLKYIYRFSEPQCWDVVVFKNPQDNHENYIKRLIGLPGQMLEIVHGDVFVRDGKDFDKNGIIDENDFADPRAKAQCPWRILRKRSHRVQEVMWQVVFDNDYRPPPLQARKNGWKSPWSTRSNRWDLTGYQGRVFRFRGSDDPEAVVFSPDTERFHPNYAYNHTSSGVVRPYDPKIDVNYDLKLSFMYVPKSKNTSIALHLSSFRHHFLAKIDSTGYCQLLHGLSDDDVNIRWDKQPWGEKKLLPLKKNKPYLIALTHVDYRVTLWINDEPILQSTDEQYPANHDEAIEQVKQTLQRHPEGLPAPKVAILAKGGAAQLWHIKLMRDVYYTCPHMQSDETKPGRATTGNPFVLRKFFKNPDLDEFFVLGDNSPASLDSRLWEHHAPSLRKGYRDGTVPRYNLIGRAFFVYWPGGFRLPMLKRLAIVPNVGRMRLIR